MQFKRWPMMTKHRKALLGIALLAPVALIAIAPKVWHRLSPDESPTPLATKASERRGGKGDAEVAAMTSQEAAAELRRMCRARTGPLKFTSFDEFYELRRLRLLVNRLSLDEVQALRTDPELRSQDQKPRQLDSIPTLASALLEKLGERWGELAPAEALSMGCFNTPDGGFHFRAFIFRDFLKGAAKGDPEAAMAFWKEHLRDLKFGDDEDLFAPNYLGSVIEGAAEGNPAKAWALLNDLDAASRSDHLVAGYFGALPAGSDWQKALERLESCGPVVQRGMISSAAIALARSWMRDDPAAALRWLDATTDSLRGERANDRWASITRSNAYGNKAAVYSQALEGWLYEDPIEAIRWLREWTPAEVSKVQVLRETMDGCTPVIERELLGVPDSAEEREQLMLALARDARGTEDFDSLLATGGVSKKTMDELRRMKEQFNPAQR